MGGSGEGGVGDRSEVKNDKEEHQEKPWKILRFGDKQSKITTDN